MSELSISAFAADSGIPINEAMRLCREALERKRRLAPPAKLKDRRWNAHDGWPATNIVQRETDNGRACR